MAGEETWNGRRSLRRPSRAVVCSGSNDRQWQTFSVTSTLIFDDQGGLREVVASFHDVTDVDRAHKQLREAIGELPERSRTKGDFAKPDALEQTNESNFRLKSNAVNVQDEREELNRQLIGDVAPGGMVRCRLPCCITWAMCRNSINVPPKSSL